MSKLAERQMADAEKFYELVDCHGGGTLLPWIKLARQSNDYGVLDEYLETMVGYSAQSNPISHQFITKYANGPEKDIFFYV